MSNIAIVNALSGLANLTYGQRRWVLVGLLVLLHLLLLQGIESGVGRTLLVVHIGLFILWQPFVRAEQRLSWLQLAVIAAVVLGSAIWISWWLMIFWVMALAGIVGGKVFFFAARRTKVLYLLVLTYLVGVLLVFLVPQVIPQSYVMPQIFFQLAKYGLPVLFPLMALLPLEQEAEDEVEVIDFVYSAFVFLILAVLVLGSVAAMLLINRGYIESLVYTLVILSAVLFLLAWAWNPRVGFTGLNVLFSRYLLSIGLPFERWLHYLAEHSQREDQPDKFLDDALSGMSRLPWVAGGKWRAAGKEGGFGRHEGQCSEFRHNALSLAVYTRHPLSPALIWHFDLLAQLLGEFYQAKLRGQELQKLSYVRAIHETGARLTHDVKNLLQSLNALCFAAASEGEEISPQFQALLRRQLPVISQRLQQTMDKLRRPELESTQYVPLGRWWAALRGRYAENGVAFEPESVAGEMLVPATLFNGVAENLLENALAKRQGHPDLRIRVSIAAEAPLSLTVCDDGAAIPDAVAADLFRAPVASHAGLGIGLYQAARHAEFYRYALGILSNRQGRVCFELRQPAGEGTTPQ